MNTISHGGLSDIMGAVRENAVNSFEYFANTVVGAHLDTVLCEKVQDTVEEREDAHYHTTRPRSLCVALQGWLTSRGVIVNSAHEATSHEVLRWLDLGLFSAQEPVVNLPRAEITTLPAGVVLKWLQ
jgi:hypothetical protein